MAIVPPRSSDTASLSLVVPVFNEQDRLRESGPELAEFVSGWGRLSELIIADDGSTDATVRVAEELAASCAPGTVRILQLPHRGKGASVQSGLAAARSAAAAFCDVDLATPLDDMRRLVELSFTAPVVVAASRDVVTTRLVNPESPQRELLGKLYNRLVQVTLVPGIRDTQCGAKAATTPVWRAILRHTKEAGFAWDVEALAVARRLGFAVWEVGVAWSHDARSRVRPMRDGLAMVKAVPRIWESLHAVQTFASFEHLEVDLRDDAPTVLLPAS